MDLTHKNFWELSPYCFCKGRDWLTIDNILITTTIPPDGESQQETAVFVSGMSKDDTALLAAFLTALALFLFLLFLLLCCLFPWGLCCRDNKDGGGGCCGGKGKKRKDAFISFSDNSSSGSVNMTALDMKIPRPWMDSNEGYSDSEFDKSGRLYAETNLDNTDQRGFTNEGYQKDSTSSFFRFQDGGWFSASDLDSVYGDGSTGRGSSSRRRRRRSFDGDTGSASGTMTRGHLRSSQINNNNNNMSRSVDNIDSIMTYSRNQTHENESNAGARSQHVVALSSSLSPSQALAAANSGNDVTSFTRYHSDGVTGIGGGSGGAIVEELKLTRTKTLQLPQLPTASMVQNSAGQQERIGEFPSMTSPMPYMETTNQIQIVPPIEANSRNAVSAVTNSVTSQDRPQDNDVISEYRAYKRVMKETTTTTTTSESE